MSRTARAIEFEKEYKDRVIGLISELYIEYVDSQGTTMHDSNGDAIKVLQYRDPKKWDGKMYGANMFGVSMVDGKLCQMYTTHLMNGICTLGSPAEHSETQDLVEVLKSLEDKFCEYLKNS